MSRIGLPITMMAFALAACAPTQLVERPGAVVAFTPQTGAGADFTPLTYDRVEPFALMPRP
jgi:hypothetical protein